MKILIIIIIMLSVLPAVLAFGDTDYYIIKQNITNITYTNITYINNQSDPYNISNGNIGLQSTTLQNFWFAKYADGLGADDSGVFFNVQSGKFEFKVLNISIFDISTSGDIRANNMQANNNIQTGDGMSSTANITFSTTAGAMNFGFDSNLGLMKTDSALMLPGICLDGSLTGDCSASYQIYVTGNQSYGYYPIIYLNDYSGAMSTGTFIDFGKGTPGNLVYYSGVWDAYPDRYMITDFSNFYLEAYNETTKIGTELVAVNNITAGGTYISQGMAGINKTIQIMKDVNLTTLIKTYCNITITGGIITNTTC